MLRAPENDKGGGQAPLPGIGDDDGKGDGKATDAEKRAAAAEKRAAELEAKERKRVEDEESRKREAAIKTTDDAKAAAADAERRAKEATKRAEAAEKRIRERIDKRFETLESSTRERIAKYRDRLSIEDWETMVEEEAERMAPGGGDDDNPIAGAPPAQPAGAGRRNHARDGRELHPKSQEILDTLGIDTEPARKAIVVDTEREGGVVRGRFVYPQTKLRKMIRERALMGPLLSDDERRKLLGL